MAKFWIFLFILRTKVTVSEHLLRCDLHGAYITVIRSKCATLVGYEGTVVCENKNILTLASKDGQIRAFQKIGLVLSVEINGLGVFHVYCEQLMSRASSRSSKKVKWHPVLKQV